MMKKLLVIFIIIPLLGMETEDNLPKSWTFNLVDDQKITLSNYDFKKFQMLHMLIRRNDQDIKHPLATKETFRDLIHIVSENHINGLPDKFLPALKIVLLGDYCGIDNDILNKLIEKLSMLSPTLKDLEGLDNMHKDRILIPGKIVLPLIKVNNEETGNKLKLFLEKTSLPLWGITEISSLEMPKGNDITSLCFSPDSRHIAAELKKKNSNSIKILDIRLQELAKTLRLEEGMGKIISINYSYDGKYLAVGCHNKNKVKNEMILYDAKSLEKKHTLEGYGHNACFRPDGKLVVTASIRQAQIWQYINAKFIKMGDPLIFNYTINKLSFSPDGQRFALAEKGPQNQFLYIYRTQDWGIEKKFDNAKHVSFSPDWNYLALATGKKVKILSLKADKKSFWNSISTLLSSKTDTIVTSFTNPHPIEEIYFTKNYLAIIDIQQNDPSYQFAKRQNEEQERQWNIKHEKKIKEFVQSNKKSIENSTYSSGSSTLLEHDNYNPYEDEHYHPSQPKIPFAKLMTLWNIENGKAVKSFEYSGKCIAFNPQGEYMALEENLVYQSRIDIYKLPGKDEEERTFRIKQRLFALSKKSRSMPFLKNNVIQRHKENYKDLQEKKFNMSPLLQIQKK